MEPTMIPILCYHRIAELPANHPLRPYSVTPSAFARQMAYLATHSYRCVALTDLEAAPQAGDQRCFALTFDDGTLDCYETASPICEPYGFHPTVFLVSRWLVDCDAADAAMGPLLTSAHVLEMRRRGVSFGAHSRTHRRLVGLSAQEARAEVCGCKAEIEQVLGEPVTTFAYPFGLSNPAVREAVATCGYALAVAVDNGSEERFNLRREPVGVDDTLLSFAWKVTGGRDRWRGLRASLLRAANLKRMAKDRSWP
jgi:peptidoglycan/xylan/chitin deacetylase (PgdA/CDA1 family)